MSETPKEHHTLVLPDEVDIKIRRLSGDMFSAEYVERFYPRDGVDVPKAVRNAAELMRQIIKKAKGEGADNAKVEVLEGSHGVVITVEDTREAIGDMLIGEFLIWSDIGKLEVRELLLLAWSGAMGKDFGSTEYVGAVAVLTAAQIEDMTRLAQLTEDHTGPHIHMGPKIGEETRLRCYVCVALARVRALEGDVKRLNGECQTAAEKGVAWLNQLMVAIQERDALKKMLVKELQHARNITRENAEILVERALPAAAGAPSECCGACQTGEHDQCIQEPECRCHLKSAKSNRLEPCKIVRRVDYDWCYTHKLKMVHGDRCFGVPPAPETAGAARLANARDCEHGQLRRSCEICELEARVRELGIGNADLLKQRTRLCDRLEERDSDRKSMQEIYNRVYEDRRKEKANVAHWKDQAKTISKNALDLHDRYEALRAAAEQAKNHYLRNGNYDDKGAREGACLTLEKALAAGVVCPKCQSHLSEPDAGGSVSCPNDSCDYYRVGPSPAKPDRESHTHDYHSDQEGKAARCRKCGRPELFDTSDPAPAVRDAEKAKAKLEVEAVWAKLPEKERGYLQNMMNAGETRIRELEGNLADARKVGECYWDKHGPALRAALEAHHDLPSWGESPESIGSCHICGLPLASAADGGK